MATLTACGSQVDPSVVARVQGQQLAPGQVDPSAGVLGTRVAGQPQAGGGTGTSSGTATGGGSATGGQVDAPAAAPVGEGRNAADGGVEAGSCAGFENSTGITDSEITIANISDISGPVPGLFQAAQDATKAFVTYYNSTDPDGICGRSLRLSTLDTRSDAAGDQQAYTRACAEAFAAVGSVAQQDQGGAATAEACGLPDLRSFSLSADRADCATCFAAYAIRPHLRSSSLGTYWAKAEPEATERIGIYYVDVPAATTNAQSFAAAFDEQGLEVVRTQAIGTSEFNYAPYAQQMKDDDIRFVMYFGPFQFTIRLQEAMRQQGVEAVFLTDPTVYDSRYVEQGGEAVQGTYVYSALQQLDDTSIPEMVLYRQWLERSSPGSEPNTYGLFAWSAARLFVQEATRLGGRLTRENLVEAVSEVADWTANGIHAPMAVGSKVTGGCLKMIQLVGDSWRKVSPGDFVCGPIIDTGVGK